MTIISANLDERLLALMTEWLPALAVIAVTALVVVFGNRKPAIDTDGVRFRRQLLVLLAVVTAIVALILTLPVTGETRGQLLTLLGLLLTAVITLSSPTIAANILSGMMLRSLRSFSPGDFIQVGDYFGRVTEIDLFHTEIQTAERDLLTIPHVYLGANPVKVVHASGTLVTAEVSLGYDVDHRRIEHALIDAANAADLTDPFVYVTGLGDYSVVYRISGYLADVKHLLSARSNLRKQMLDYLHGNGIEIVSPAFMNQRQVTSQVIPTERRVSANSQNEQADQLVFDKAERAQQLEELKNHYEELTAEIAELEKQPDKDTNMIERKVRRLKAIKRAVSAVERQNGKPGKEKND